MSIHITSASAQVLRAPVDSAVLITPVPADVPAPDLRQGGKAPAATYEYRDGEGGLVAIIARYEDMGKKRFTPVTLWLSPDGSAAWHYKGIDDNRPLYRLPHLSTAPTKPVLLVEGEKCADAIAGFAGWVSTTWMGGAKAVAKTDYTPLKGRNVLILPDLDDPGAEAAAKLVDILQTVGAAEVSLMDPGKLAAEFGMPEDTGYDIADAIAAGLTEEMFADLVTREGWVQHCTPQTAPEEEEPENPVFREIVAQFGLTPEVPPNFRLEADGLWKFAIDRHGREVEHFVGSPLAVLGRTRTGVDGPGWGYLVVIKSPTGDWVKQVVPARLIAGDGREMRELLAMQGFMVPQDRAGRQGLAEYIGYSASKRIVDVVSRPGWYNGAFLTPNEILHPEGAAQTVILDMAGRENRFGQAGSRERWLDLAKMLENNSRSAFSLCVALSAPMLRLMGQRGGGFHLHATSSRAKTTTLTVAGAVWGGGTDGYIHSWKLTSAGAEALLARYNDLFLALDETTLADPDLVVETSYMTGNGHGMGRANRDGTARTSARWVTQVLSSGEYAIGHKLSQEKGKPRMSGGQAVRMIDVPFEITEDIYFEDLAGEKCEKDFVNKITELSLNNYGFAGPEFLRHLVADPAGVAKRAHEIAKDFVDEVVTETDDPQVHRVAMRFAIAAAAGTLATEWKILPWKEKSATIAARTCFHAWKHARGGGKSEDARRALADLKGFFEAHGRSRFESISTSQAPDDVPVSESPNGVYNRCGYREHDEDGPIYYVLPQMWRTELCGGHDPDLMVKVAREAGALICGEDGRPQKKKRLPDYPNGTRVYVIRPSKLP